MIGNSTRLCKAAFNIWNELLEPLRRLGVSPGRSSRLLLTTGRLLCFTVLLWLFLTSQVSRTPARWRWSASLWTAPGPCRLLEWNSEPHPSRLSDWQRGSRGWHDGHSSFSSAQISFGPTKEPISSCDPSCTAIFPTA